MPSKTAQTGIHLLFLFVIIAVILYVFEPTLFPSVLAKLADWPQLQSFKTMFISIVLEALPFMLLGVLVSAIIQVFVSEETIARLVPRNPLLGLVFGCLLGMVFPLCECGVIPVIRRLLAKGMPLYIGIVFIVVGPIVNPVVWLATYAAFRSNPEMVYGRLGVALVVGFAIGLAVYLLFRGNQLRTSKATLYGEEAVAPVKPAGTGNRLLAIMEHAGSEFFDMGKYLLFGCAIAALMQTTIPRAGLIEVGQAPLGSHLFMMAFAFILSICSTSDAFVAKSFFTTFSSGSLLTFLVFGPMLDMKSLLMLLTTFRARFVLVLALMIAVFVFGGVSLYAYFVL